MGKVQEIMQINLLVKNIKSLCAANGVSVAEFARVTGLGKSGISRLWRGGVPTRKQAEIICDNLCGGNESIDAIIEWARIKPTSERTRTKPVSKPNSTVVALKKLKDDKLAIRVHLANRNTRSLITAVLDSSSQSTR